MLGNLLIIAILLVPIQIPPAQDPKTEITEKEAIAFARKIERDLLDDEPETFDAAFDIDGLLNEAIKGLDLQWGEAVGYKLGVKKSLSLGKVLAARSGSSYRFLRLRPGDGPRRLVFRLRSKDGINYHEWRLNKAPKGDIRIEDLLAYFNGDWMAPIFRRGALAMIAADPDRREKLEGLDRDLAMHLPKLKELDQESREGEPEKALALYESLPDALKRDKLVLIARLRAASRSKKDEFPEAEARFREVFPDEFYDDYVGFGVHASRKRYDQALNSIENLDRHLGGDAFLHVDRGHLYLALDKLGDAKKSGLIAAKEVPYLPGPRWLFVAISLKERAHLETVKLLVSLEIDFNLVMGNFEANPMYADFVKSQEYRDWMKSRASK